MGGDQVEEFSACLHVRLSISLVVLLVENEESEVLIPPQVYFSRSYSLLNMYIAGRVFRICFIMLKSTLMSIKKKRRMFYAWIYGLIFVLAILALVINIKTLPLIEARQKLVVETQKEEEENHELELKMLSGTGYFQIEKTATEKLHMVIPETIFYIDSK